MKIVIIGCGTLFLGCLIWLLSGYILITAPWAPLHDLLTPNLEFAFLLILMGAIYGIMAYILYRFGKKREWKFSPYYQK